jgi:hypothetical protein
MKKWFDWEDYYPLLFTVIVIGALIGLCVDAVIKAPKRASEAKQDAENICLAFKATAIYVMVNPEVGTGKTYTPAKYEWNCLLQDGVTVINPYK